jgi:hypothetical protein
MHSYSDKAGGSLGAGSKAANGGACSSTDDCAPLDCACSDGQATEYRGCRLGVCDTECPRKDAPAGDPCSGGGCFCKSGSCASSTNNAVRRGEPPSGAPAARAIGSAGRWPRRPPRRWRRGGHSAFPFGHAGLFAIGVDATGTALAPGAIDPHHVLSSDDPAFRGPHAYVPATGDPLAKRARGSPSR